MRILKIMALLLGVLFIAIILIRRIFFYEPESHYFSHGDETLRICSTRYDTEINAIYYIDCFGKKIPLSDGDISTFKNISLPSNWRSGGFYMVGSNPSHTPAYAKDRYSVFYDGIRIPQANAESFELLTPPGYAKDKASVFYEGQLLEGADPKTFSFLEQWHRRYPCHYAKDTQHVWYQGNVLQNVDAATFEVLRDDNHPDSYTKDKYHVYLDRNIISGADPNSFEKFAGDYSKDKNHVYQSGKIFPQADPNTFEPIAGGWLFRDKKRVYKFGHIIAGADPQTFEPIYVDNNEYSKDKSHVYYWNQIQDQIIPGADSDTFTAYWDGYSKDKNHVYKEGNVISDVNSKTFIDPLVVFQLNHFTPAADPNTLVRLDREYLPLESVATGYSKDKNHVYINGKFIAEADLSTFEWLKGQYSKDKNYAYVDGRIISDADPVTFIVLSNRYAKDKNHVYESGRIMPNVDSATFVVITSEYAKDRNHVYKFGRIVPNADPETYKYTAP